LIAIALALLAFPAGASADSCDDYTAQAVSDANAALSLGCAAAASSYPDAFTGPRWTTNPADHESWCRSTGGQPVPNPQYGNETQAQAETNARQNQLGLCKMCNAYAQGAVVQAETAIRMNCGLTGDEWSNSVAFQMHACFDKGFAFTVPVINLENTDRDRKLKACQFSGRATLGSRPLPSDFLGPKKKGRPIH